MPPASIFTETRRTTWSLLVAVVLANVCATVVVNVVLFQGRVSTALISIYEATGYLIQGALVGGLLSLAVVGVVIFGLARLRPADIGWNRRDLAIGLLVTLVFWLAMNAIMALIAAITGGVALNSAWTNPGTTPVVGAILGQLLGNAFQEETVFRGILLPQLYLKTVKIVGSKLAMAVACLGSSALFAISHLPNRLYTNVLAGSELAWDQGGLLLFALLFAAVYVVTRNLFIAVGLHALVNAPTPLVHSANQMTPHAVWFALLIILLAAWPAVQAARQRWEKSPKTE